MEFTSIVFILQCDDGIPKLIQIVMEFPSLMPAASAMSNRRAKGNSLRRDGSRPMAQKLSGHRRKALPQPGKVLQKRPGIGQRRSDVGKPSQAMSATQELRPMMAPPPKLPNYWRAPHQKPLKRTEKAAVSQRRQEPDREVITHMNDADPGFLPPDLHNYILDGQPMHLPGTSFTDFDGASSRKFLNKKTTKKEKGGWATVKSLPLIPQARSEMVS